MILSIAQYVWNLTKAFGILPSFSYPTTNGFWVEFWVGMKVGHTCITYFAKSKTGPQGDASHILWSRRASVWKFYNVPILNIFGTPLNHESLLFFWMNTFIRKYGLSLFLFFFFSLFFYMLFGMHTFFSHAFWHGYFFSFF